MLLLLLVAALGGLAALAVTAGANMARRGAEEALLAAGEDFERALLAYRTAPHFGRAAGGPKSLGDLLVERSPGGRIRRYLRRVHEDPLTGRADWGLVRASDGSIVAVYSKAPGVPIKRAGFAPRGEAWFAQAPSYSSWCFGLAYADSMDRHIWGEARLAGCQIPETYTGR